MITHRHALSSWRQIRDSKELDKTRFRYKPNVRNLSAEYKLKQVIKTEIGILFVVIFTSPKAPFPIIVNNSKSSAPILCLWRRMYSVSFFSKNFNKLLWSSSDTSASASFFSSKFRLLTNKCKIVTCHQCRRRGISYPKESKTWCGQTSQGNEEFCCSCTY